MTSLKYFNENRPDIHIVATGSALGVLQHKGFSFPVGKVESVYLKPFSFIEFINNVEGEDYAHILNDTENLSLYKTKLEEMLKLYYYVGGMPAVVKNFTKKQIFLRFLFAMSACSAQ